MSLFSIKEKQDVWIFGTLLTSRYSLNPLNMLMWFCSTVRLFAERISIIELLDEVLWG